jgi:hypothetical protein
MKIKLFFIFKTKTILDSNTHTHHKSIVESYFSTPHFWE